MFKQFFSEQQRPFTLYFTRQTYLKALIPKVSDRQPCRLKSIRRYISSVVLCGLLAGCGFGSSKEASSQTSETINTYPQYGCIGTIRTLSLNDPNTGQLLTRMEDHTSIRIDGEVSDEQDRILDDNAKIKEGNPDADYDWYLVTFVGKDGHIWRGAAAKKWIDPPNPIDRGCNHAPGQDVHNGYGETYEGK